MAIDNIENAPVTTPTTNELVEIMESAYKTELGTSEVPKKSPEKAIMVAVASVVILLFRKCSWVFRQIFASTANDENTAKRGAEKGLVLVEGNKERLTATITGADNIPLDTRFEYDELVYLVDTIVDSGTITLIANDIGSEYNRDIGDELDIVVGIGGVGEKATVTIIDVIGTDSETEDEFNDRVIANEKANPQGGNPYSYFIWTIEVNDVVDAYVYLNEDYTINIMGVGSGLNSDRILTQNKMDEITASIEQSPGSIYGDRRSITDNVSVVPGSTISVETTINGWGVDDEVLEGLVEESLEQYLNSLRSINEGTGKYKENASIDVATMNTIANEITINSTYKFSVTISVTANGQPIPSSYPIEQYLLANFSGVTYNA